MKLFKITKVNNNLTNELIHTSDSIETLKQKGLEHIKAQGLSVPFFTWRTTKPVMGNNQLKNAKEFFMIVNNDSEDILFTLSIEKD